MLGNRLRGISGSYEICLVLAGDDAEALMAVLGNTPMTRSRMWPAWCAGVWRSWVLSISTRAAVFLGGRDCGSSGGRMLHISSPVDVGD